MQTVCCCDNFVVVITHKSSADKKQVEEGGVVRVWAYFSQNMKKFNYQQYKSILKKENRFLEW